MSVNPDLTAAISDLRQKGVLQEPGATRLARVAHGDLVSLRSELRVMLYAGVLAVITGAGLLVQRNLEHIGPAAIALALGAGASAAMLWVARKAPPFSWDEVPSPNLAFDYMLLLGVLLAATDLAYVEVKFTALGQSWPWHLLLVAVFTAWLAFRYDSRIVFSLALTSFAAWRGASLAAVGNPLGQEIASAVRLNAIVCGAFFVLLGVLLVRIRKKPHFEPVSVHVGFLLVLLALASGMVFRAADHLGYDWALLLCGAGVAAGAFRAGRFALFVMGVLGGYAGVSALVIRVLDDAEGATLWFTLSSLMLLACLLLAHRWMRRSL